jgi:hypothetical protein
VISRNAAGINQQPPKKDQYGEQRGEKKLAAPIRLILGKSENTRYYALFKCHWAPRQYSTLRGNGKFQSAVRSFTWFPFPACDWAVFRYRVVIFRMRGKPETGYSAHLFQELGHFHEVLKVDFFPSLNVLDMAAPFRILIGGAFEPDPGNERLNDLRSNHQSQLYQACSMCIVVTLKHAAVTNW